METVDITLKSSYFFPAVPYNKSLWEDALSSQFLSNNSDALAELHKIMKVTTKVRCALRMADKKMFAKAKGDENMCELGRVDKNMQYKSIRDRGPPIELDSTAEYYNLLQLDAVESLKRNDGREVDYRNDIRGKKYVMACVLSVPDSCDSYAWEVARKSAELYADHPNFECVIFLRQRLLGWEKFASLEGFYQQFDPSCIIIPLNETMSAGFLYHKLLVIDRDDNVLLHCPLEALSDLESAAFPFTESYVKKLWKDRCNLSHSSLEILLGVKPCHKLFRMIPGTLQEEWKCISEFRSKIVFLYTYYCGNQLALLYNTVKELREKEGIMEFEIITAYVPACEDDRFPWQFLEAFSSAVAKLGLKWWVVPYDSSTYPRLLPLYSNSTNTDRLIVFDPKLDEGDPHGLEVLRLFGRTMFPFTKESVVVDVEKKLKQVTLRSLFECVTCLFKENIWPLEGEFREKNSVLEAKYVLVYFDSGLFPCTPLNQFVSWYKSLDDEEKMFYNFEMVCVYLDTSNQDIYNVESRKLVPKWLIPCPNEEAACAKYAVENFFLKLFNRKISTIVAFGTDGNICSLCAHRLLPSSTEGVTNPFKGDLREEILNICKEDCTELCSF